MPPTLLVDEAALERLGAADIDSDYIIMEEDSIAEPRAMHADSYLMFMT